MSYRSSLLRWPGAVELPGPSLIDASGVAFHYGDPLSEQRHLSQRPALVDRSHRAVVAVSGPDAATFLNNLLSQKLIDVAPGFAASALDLDAQGRILHHVDVSYDGETFYLDMLSGQRESLVKFFTAMVFWSDVTITETDLAIMTVLAPTSPSHEPSGSQTPHSGAACADEVFAAAVYQREVAWCAEMARTDFAISRNQVEEVAEKFVRAGGDLAGLMAFTAQRVRVGEPELTADLDAKSIPHEVPRFIDRGEHPQMLSGAVHLNKGCYRGQETVARVENLGRSPRLLVMLQLDGSAPTEPAPGAAITAGGRTVGRLGTVVHDVDYGPIALGLVKRSALAGPLDIEGVAASVDSDSLPHVEGEQAGRRAVAHLRRGRGPESAG